MPYPYYDPSIYHDEIEAEMGLFSSKGSVIVPILDWNARVAEVQQLKQAMEDKREELRTAQEMVGSLETDVAKAAQAYTQAWRQLKQDMGEA